MKNVPVYRVASDAPAEAIAKIFAIIREMNSVSKTGFNRIGEVSHRDSRQQWRMRSYIVSYDDLTAREFTKRCREAGVDAAIDYTHSPEPDRHYVDVQSSGLIKLHWHPKDSFLLVEPEMVNRLPLTGPNYIDTGIVAKHIFFVGPNRQTQKAYRRYLNKVRELKPFNVSLNHHGLQYILAPIVTPGEAIGGAMYIVTEDGLVARLTPNRFEWVTNRMPKGPEEELRRALHGYNEIVIDAGKEYRCLPGIREREYSGTNPAFNESMALAAFTKDAYLKL